MKYISFLFLFFLFTCIDAKLLTYNNSSPVFHYHNDHAVFGDIALFDEGLALGTRVDKPSIGNVELFKYTSSTPYKILSVSGSSQSYVYTTGLGLPKEEQRIFTFDFQDDPYKKLFAQLNVYDIEGNNIYSYTLPIRYGPSMQPFAVSNDGKNAVVIGSNYDTRKAVFYHFDDFSSGAVPFNKTFTDTNLLVDITDKGFAFVEMVYSIFVYDMVNKEERTPIKHKEVSMSISVSHDAEYIAYGWDRLEIYKWNSTLKVYQIQKGTNGPPNTFIFTTFAAMDSPNLVVVWQDIKVMDFYVETFRFGTPIIGPLSTWKSPKTLEPNENQVQQVKFTSDGEYYSLVSWGDKKGEIPTVLLFKFSQADPIASCNTPGSMLYTDIFKHNNKIYFAAAGKHHHESQKSIAGDAFVWSYEQEDY